jgi:2-methylcitrate dehydratase PrpD
MVLGVGDKFPAHYTARVNSVFFCRTYDFEPTGALVEGKSTPSHISGTTVPTALSVGEWVGATGKDVLTALVVGEDFGARLDSASQLNIDSGWDSTGTTLTPPSQDEKREKFLSNVAWSQLSLVTAQGKHEVC